MTHEKFLFQAHPWHGISVGEQSPQVVNAFIEIVPTDVHKYEIDKATGHLKVDRPQKYSSQCPCCYGFIPQTYCGERVGAFSAQGSQRGSLLGDRDPLDICVLTERPIQRGGVLLRAVPIGGFRIIDRNEADDKIIAVLYEDGVYGHWKDISDCPPNLVRRLSHYFLTYKGIPGEGTSSVELAGSYGAATAQAVIVQSQEDYKKTYL